MTPFLIRRRLTPAGPRWTLYQRRQSRDLVAILFPLERISEHRTHAQAVARMDFELRWIRARARIGLGPSPRPWPLLGVDALQQSTPPTTPPPPPPPAMADAVRMNTTPRRAAGAITFDTSLHLDPVSIADDYQRAMTQQRARRTA